MELTLYQIDAFTSEVFGGNPAAVVPLEAWLDDATLQAIATENNLSETAYTVPAGGGYELRWFTPASEIELCGHATLATAHVVFTHLRPDLDAVRFETRFSGELSVTRANGLLIMDFPVAPLEQCNPTEDLAAGLSIAPRAVFAGPDYMAVYDSAADVLAVEPDHTALMRLDRRGVIVTGPGDTDGPADFVSRFFCPKYGVPEDPVCGSAHCMLTPYWAGETGRSTLLAHQVSARGGELHCRLDGARVELKGNAVQYLEGRIEF